MAEFVMWVVVGWFAVNALVTVARVGKPAIGRVTPGGAVIAVVIYAALIVLVLAAWGGSGG